jgi:hypothetical protein
VVSGHFSSVIPAKGVQRHVTLKHDLTLTVYRTGEIPALAGMTMERMSYSGRKAVAYILLPIASFGQAVNERAGVA